MQWSARPARLRANLCVAACFAAGIGGFFSLVGSGPAVAGDLTPAEVVVTRFPPGWNFGPAPHLIPAPVWPSAPAVMSAPRSVPSAPASDGSKTASRPAAPALAPVLASATSTPRPAPASAPAPAAARTAPAPAPTDDADAELAVRYLFSPHPTYPPTLASAGGSQPALPAHAMGYADPAVESAPATRTSTTLVDRTASVPRPAERRAAPARPQDTAVVFNEAQIASIKDRLALTAEQQRYWPAVAAALRGITRQRP